ncbi:TonB-dependent receptor [Sphingomonas colocasiae]|uniref:TonB-dependent receptor n=1 Tax=Sphingomonas colocasiae TaxID=1848973 RepID=A0ABS7PPV3_9SPHN|nr:TonB-dependent receptor [Sphingomonas colocasiae]MBY8823357.1 TonB-dependent receptor [Sphingomonas colocasiae]
MQGLIAGISFERRLMAGAAVIAAVAVSAPAVAQTRNFDVPEQPASRGIPAFAKQAGVQILASGSLVAGKRTKQVRGRYPVEEGLRRLLDGTGLVASFNGSGQIITIQPAPAAKASAVEEERAAASEEIVVTGTNIRGVEPDSSPIQRISRTEIDARGAVTAEQLITQLPANFNSVNANAVGATRDFSNVYAVNGVDLRGLGPGTTLVLLNGRRLAPSANGIAVDVSLIPMPAVERVDILTDSASSIYGSDAVGGVVNFVLQDRFDGLEAAAGIGFTDDGAQDEFRGALTAGTHWSSGHIVASVNYLDRSPLDTSERSFARGVTGLYYLVPKETRGGLFISAGQRVGNRLALSGEVLVGGRDTSQAVFRYNGLSGGRPNTVSDTYDGRARNQFVSLGASYDAGAPLRLELAGSFSRVNETSHVTRVPSLTPASEYTTRSLTRGYDIGLKADGVLVQLRSGKLAYSVGGGFTRESLVQDNAITVVRPKRSTRYAFGELHVPLIGPDNAVPMIHRFEANLSGRYSDYSDFGSDFSPKVGLLWSPVSGFNIRGSYGLSFRAPYLSNLAEGGIYQLYNVTGFGLPSPMPGVASPVGLYIDAGVVSDLQPETAKILTFGTDIKPAPIPGLGLSITFVRIDYDNRISRGDTSRGTGFFFQPSLYPELFNFSPSRDDLSEILATARVAPGNVTGFDQSNLDALVNNVDYIVDNRLRNIASSKQRALDAALSYQFALGRTEISLGGQATYILSYKARTAPSSGPISQINQFGKPADFRAMSYAGFRHDQFSARLSANYITGYDNPITPASPHIDDWLTLDLTASYRFAERSGPLKGLSAHFIVQNLLDAAPPYVAELGPGTTAGLIEPIGHDPANASPIGRFISLELRKRF